MNRAICLNPNCGSVNLATVRFCDRCRTKLRLGDRYLPLSTLGEGGFGRTFLAQDEHRLNSPCVIKQFLLTQHNPKAIALFHQEAQHLFNLGKHPQIPELFAFFEQDGQLYLIQEWIEGQTLQQQLQQQIRLSETAVIALLTALLPVLAFIHGQNVIHRDIKPENILQRLDGTWVLIDFGVSKVFSQTLISPGTITGTYGYAAPEQLRGIVYPSSDLYSLGITAARSLTGCLPYTQNDTIIDEIFDPLTLQWRWQEKLQELGITLTPSFTAILHKLTQEQANQRFQSATDVLAALQTPKPQNRLQYYLSHQQWQQADTETARLLFQSVNRTQEAYLRLEDIFALPIPLLQEINRNWLNFSNNRFGFSTQARLYQTLSQSTQFNPQQWQNFGKTVGWYRRDRWLDYDELMFDFTAPVGHLPVAIGLGVGWGENGLAALISRFFNNLPQS